METCTGIMVAGAKTMETCAIIMDTCARTMITYAKTMDTCTKTMETCARIMDTCTGNMETCARIRRPAPKSGDLHRSSSNECRYSAAPAPLFEQRVVLLCHASTVTLPHRHRHSATPTQLLCRTSTVTSPHRHRHSAAHVPSY